MADFVPKYRFLLNDTEVQLPLADDELGYEWEKADDTFYFRKKLSGKIRFSLTEYNTIQSASVEDLFTFKIQKYDGSVYNDDFVGSFYKTDCEINEDDGLVDVKPKPDDGYEEFKRVLNNEYNLIDLAPVATPVSYTIRPILQIVVMNVDSWQTLPPRPDVFSGSDKLTNVVGAATYEETLDKTYSFDELVTAFTVKTYSFGDSELVFYRYLTTLDTFNSVATIDRPDGDISSIAPFYDKISFEVDTDLIVDLEYFQTEPSKFGSTFRCSTNPNLYYRDYQEFVGSNSVAQPLSPSVWKCRSLWFTQTAVNNDYEITNSEVRELADAYELSDIIQLLLEQETDIVFNSTTDYSEFFYASSNPISGRTKNTLIYTPKSNIVNAYYNNPARKSPMRLSEMLDLLWSVYKVSYHIETVGIEKRLRLEHISWYEKGGNYTGQQLSYDLTTAQDKRNRGFLSNYQNSYKYAKQKMPQRFEFAWNDDSTAFFNGDPINVLSNHIELGQIEKLDTRTFIPDIDSLTGREGVALEGWYMLDTEYITARAIYEVVFNNIEVVDGLLLRVQNGTLSYKSLHPIFHRYGMPATSLEINGEPLNAISVTRTKEQEVRFAAKNVEINPLQLVRTEIGSGQVEKMKKNIISDTFEITINHDTE
jgi:hypothetical protein